METEEILNRFPEQADELRPLLETASKARAFTDDGVPIAAMHRSRTKMLVRAEQLRRAQRPLLRRISFRRLSMQILGVLVVLGASLTSLIAASAQTLPGDSLYRIKLLSEEARISTSSPAARLNLKETFRARRIDEIQQLIEMRRSAPVAFEGVVTEINEEIWGVGGLEIAVSPETQIIGEIMPGMFVEVQGQTLATGEVRAINIYLRAYAFTGSLEAINGQIWVINSVPVLILAETQLAPGITTGTQVVVLAQVDDEGTISARAVLLAEDAIGEGDAPLEGVQATQTPTPSPTPTLVTATPTPLAIDDTETPEPEETEIELEDTDEPDETKEPDKTEEPTKTDEPDDSSSSNSGSGSSNSGSGSSGSGSGSSSTSEPGDD